MSCKCKTYEECSWLGSVASDVFGASGIRILKAMVSGEQDPEVLADLAKGTPRNKIKQIALGVDVQTNDTFYGMDEADSLELIVKGTRLEIHQSI